MVPNFWLSVWTSVKVKSKNHLHFTDFFAKIYWGHTNKDKRVQLKDKTLLYKILYFQDHAISSHPNCFVLFGHTEIVVQEVTIGDPKREYYIEVKANAVPTKEELAHALASIEQPMEGWRTFQNWFLSRLTTGFWGKEAWCPAPKWNTRFFFAFSKRTQIWLP